MRDACDEVTVSEYYLMRDTGIACAAGEVRPLPGTHHPDLPQRHEGKLTLRPAIRGPRGATQAIQIALQELCGSIREALS